MHDDPEPWRAVRRYLNAHRPELARTALALYPAALRVEGTALLTHPGWMPPGCWTCAGPPRWPPRTRRGASSDGRDVEEVTGSRPIQPAGAAVLRLAWRHRGRLLSGQPVRLAFRTCASPLLTLSYV
jgi:hypothetical protein